MAGIPGFLPVVAQYRKPQDSVCLTKKKNNRLYFSG